MSRTKRILVVDDDPYVVTLLKTKLEGSQRFEVITATSGKDAVDLAESQQPDLVISDIDMPEMDGGEVAAALKNRQTTKHIPMIFLSSLVTPQDLPKDAFLTSGRWPVMSKQSPIRDVIDRIDAMLARAQQAPT